MRAGLIVASVLGLGIVLTFGAAMVAATAFPNGTVVHAYYQGGPPPDKGFMGPNGGWVAPDGGPLPIGNTWAPGGVDVPEQGVALPGWGTGPVPQGSFAGGMTDSTAP